MADSCPPDNITKAGKDAHQISVVGCGYQGLAVEGRDGHLVVIGEGANESDKAATTLIGGQPAKAALIEKNKNQGRNGLIFRYFDDRDDTSKVCCIN